MKTYVTYGVIITFVTAVLSLILHILGFSTDPARMGTGMIIGLVGFIAICVVGIVLGTKVARAPFGTEGFSYGKAFFAGFMITVFAACTGPLYTATYYKFINPNFVETRAQWTQSFMEKMGAPESKIEKAVEDIRTKTTITREIVNGSIFTIIIGSLASLITAACLKRAPDDEPPVAA